MMCLALLDPDGTSQRQSRCLKRYVYRNKVNEYFNDINLYWIEFYRAHALCGTAMDMTN